MSSRKYGDPKRRKSTKEKGHDRRQNSCRRSSRAQTRAKVSKKRERRAGEKNIPIIRVIAQSFAPSFESLAKWLRNSPACEQPCNFSLTCEILLFLTHASFHMRNFENLQTQCLPFEYGKAWYSSKTFPTICSTGIFKFLAVFPARFNAPPQCEWRNCQCGM